MRDQPTMPFRILPAVVTAALLVVGGSLAGAAPTIAQERDCPASPFTDRNEISNVHVENVDCAYEEAITEGFADGTYRPQADVERGQMASFIVRTLDAAGVDMADPTDDDDFPDIPGTTHEESIRRLAANDVVAGFADGTYRPTQPVDRGQIASFLLRALATARDVPVAELEAGGAPFPDIAGTTHEASVEAGYRLRLLEGFGDGTFRPNTETSREEKASLLVQLLDVLEWRAATVLHDHTVEAGGQLTGDVGATDVVAVTVDGAGLDDEPARVEADGTFSVGVPGVSAGEYEVLVTVEFADGAQQVAAFMVTVLATCESGIVALTFDDGPGPDTGEVLDVLAAHDVNATFFVLGHNVEDRPGLVQRQDAEGHAVANHTYGHERLPDLGDTAIRQTIDDADAAIRATGVEPTLLLRPPYGATDSRVQTIIADEGYTELLWTVDPEDWHPDTTAEQVVDRVVGNLHADAVVLLHDWTDPSIAVVPDASNTIEALPTIFEQAAEQGYCFGVLDDAGEIVDAAPPTLPARD